MTLAIQHQTPALSPSWDDKTSRLAAFDGEITGEWALIPSLEEADFMLHPLWTFIPVPYWAMAWLGEGPPRWFEEAWQAVLPYLTGVGARGESDFEW